MWLLRPMPLPGFPSFLHGALPPSLFSFLPPSLLPPAPGPCPSFLSLPVCSRQPPPSIPGQDSQYPSVVRPWRCCSPSHPSIGCSSSARNAPEPPPSSYPPTKPRLRLLSSADFPSHPTSSFHIIQHDNLLISASCLVTLHIWLICSSHSIPSLIDNKLLKDKTCWCCSPLYFHGRCGDSWPGVWPGAGYHFLNE